ncbi:STY4528 family pathogenicity island replication protein [Pseudomonas sp. FME51]|uniref:STY4528 family pathogenicity island replication protein n=1 Tax=Pseudomonas sp. FME51 TaxID=2742609 RepID=UPI0018694038|nr:STY4528 family pathogenicity island replication protein [Pseudomonas sp. FME51]
MMDGPHSTDGPVRLSELLGRAIDQLTHQQPPSAQPAAPPPSDGFLFSGNHHDSVPRALLLDKRLTPLERNGWQVFRLMLTDDGITAMPTYDQLAPWLASMPCAERASHETVARALTILRLTRWISLVRRRRDPRSGRIQGSLYVLHDEPLTPYEAIQLDADYLELLSQALTHASKSVQRVGATTLQELTHDPMLSGQMLPTRLEILAQRLSAQGWNGILSYPQASGEHDSEDGSEDLLRNLEDQSSDSEVSRFPSVCSSLRNPKGDRTVRRKESIKEVRTIPRTQDDLRLPKRFLALKMEQQNGALATLQSVDRDLRQALLDEWDARCASSTIRSPTGYLFGIIQKALKGEFRIWAAQKAPAAPVNRATEPRPPLAKPVDAETAKAHLARLQELLRST